MQTNPAVEQSKIIWWSESPCNQYGRKGKGLRRKGFRRKHEQSGCPRASVCLWVCSPFYVTLTSESMIQ